jgi:hypothetical protein
MTCCGYRKLADGFCLNVFVLIDTAVLFFCNAVALGLWMLSFRSLLNVCDGTYWPLVIDVYNECVWYGTNCGWYSWGVCFWLCVGN